jgi:PII-like signaling protein
MSDAQTFLLRVYIDVAATRDGEPYWWVLLERARAMGLAEIAVLKVMEAFGSGAIIHGSKAVDLAPGCHVILEIADARQAVEAFRDTLEVTDDVGLVTLEKVSVVGYGGHRHAT